MLLNRPQNPFVIQKLKNIIHFLEALAASKVYSYPKDQMTVIGVTGTDGKTTTVNLLHHILTTAGFKTGIFSTLSTAHTSSPGRGKLHQFLKQCYENKCSHVVLEVTSIGIDQFRAGFIPFKIGILTNIANNEHLDYHKTFEKYQKTKLGFLLSCPTIVANADDQSFDLLKSQIDKQKLISFGLKKNADQKAKSISYSPKGTEFVLQGEKVQTKLLGEFNVLNTLAAVTAAKELGVEDKFIIKALKTFDRPAGRLEVVVERPFVVIVDFAHTPQAFEKVLPVAKLLLKNGGRLIHVFGATGSRDKGKRPVMAKVSAKFSDQIILTHEDTYLEDKQTIVDSLEKGLLEAKFKNYQKILDRREAIETAINMARSGDVIIITGVGHQKSMNVGGKELAWSDQKVVLELLKTI